MNCDNNTRQGDGSDRSEGGDGPRYFDHSAVGWLVGEAVRHLNSDGKESEVAYRRAIELLRAREDATDEIVQLAGRAMHEDTGARWSLLYLLGDIGQPRAAGFLVDTALARLPEHDPKMGCEGPRDNEILLATMAVEALQRVATEHKDVADALLKVVGARPARPILVEGVKAAVALGMQERVREMLPKDDHWMIDLRRARVEELHANAEREDGKERGFTPPRGRDQHTGPATCGCRSHQHVCKD